MLFRTISYEKKCTGSWIHISRNFFPSTRTSSSHLQSLSGILSISVVLAKSPLHWEIVTHFTGEQTQCCTNFEYWASDMTRYKSATKVQMKCDTGWFFNWSTRFSVPKWKNKLQPTRTSFSQNFQCKKAPRWLVKFFFILVLKIGRTS